MAKTFQPAVREAIDLIWQHYDAESAKRGQKMLRRAAAAGDADAWGLLSRTYLGAANLAVWETSRLPEDLDEADECVRWSILGGSAVGVLCAIERRGLYPSERAAILEHWGSGKAVLEEAATYAEEGGEAIAAELLGNCYLSGAVFGLLDDWDMDDNWGRTRMALPYLERSLEMGLALGLDNFKACADIIYERTGERDKQEQAAAMMEKFCQAGVPHTLYNRGELHYARGEYEQAYTCYEQAAAAGHEMSRFSMGYMYRFGLGVEQSAECALKEYFLSLAEDGHLPSMIQAAEIYFWGDLGEKDFTKAYSWCEKVLDKYVELAGKNPFQASGFNYDLVLPLMCYCKYYGWGTVIDREMAVRTIMEEIRRVEEEGSVLPEYKLALLYHLKGDIYANGSGNYDVDKSLARTYHEQAKSYAGFDRWLGDFKWDKSSEGFGCRFAWAIFGRYEDEKTELTDVENIRVWQEERMQKARLQAREKLQPWRLCIQLPSEGGANFVRYEEEELENALNLVACGVYRRLMLDKMDSDDRLLVRCQAKKFQLYANVNGQEYFRETTERKRALACLQRWCMGKGIKTEKWMPCELVPKTHKEEISAVWKEKTKDKTEQFIPVHA